MNGELSSRRNLSNFRMTAVNTAIVTNPILSAKKDANGDRSKEASHGNVN